MLYIWFSIYWDDITICNKNMKLHMTTGDFVMIYKWPQKHNPKIGEYFQVRIQDFL